MTSAIVKDWCSVDYQFETNDTKGWILFKVDNPQYILPLSVLKSFTVWKVYLFKPSKWKIETCLKII